MEEQDMAQVQMVVPLVSVGLTADLVMIILTVGEIIVVAAVPILEEIVVGDWMSHTVLAMVHVLTTNLAAI